MSSTFNILMYSHDTYGLGHIRRTMAIASNLRAGNMNILILTGSPIAGRFDFPEQIDFVRIPGMIKKSNDQYLPHSIRIDPEQALSIRQSIITATAKSFRPHMFIVDKAPLGLKREIMPTLEWMKEQDRPVHTVLGLRDIMDDSESTIKDWQDKQIYQVLEDLYSEIWVYGHREIYDAIKEYRIPESIAKKIIFTGYIPRKTATPRKNGKNCDPSIKKVLVTTGGGGDGYPLLDTFLTAMEQNPCQCFRPIIVSGPFMPKQQRRDISSRSKRLGIPFMHFYRQIEKLYAKSDLVVSMGGYNTFCEILSSRKPGLIIPRENPRLEQLIRAKVMSEKKLVDYIKWDRMTPDTLLTKINQLLADPSELLEHVADFKMTGLEVMRRRTSELQSQLL